MKSQFPSAAPVQFPDTVAGYIDCQRHDHGWRVGSGYCDPDELFNEEAARQEAETAMPNLS